MSKPLISLMSAALLASASMAATAADMIPPETASRFIGQDGMVCGKVEKARYAEGSEG